MGSCGLVLGTRRNLEGGTGSCPATVVCWAADVDVLRCALAVSGCRGGVPGRCCSVPGWGCDDLGRGLVAVATLTMATNINPPEDNDNTHAMVAGACGR